MSTFFTLVIPTYNRANIIVQTLHTLCNQDYKNFEVCVIDDGSTDNTKSVIDEFKKNNPQLDLKYIFQQNRERGAARNTGIKQSRGEYVSFLDSDDLLKPNHFSVANNIVSENINIEIFHLAYQLVNQNGDILETRPQINQAENKHLIVGNFISCNGIFIRNDIIKANLFSENRKIALFEDWELWLRLATQYKFHFFNTVTSCIVNHSDRSVLEINNEKLVSKTTTFMKLVLTNSDIVCYYSRDLKKFKVSCYSYISLHLALTKKYKIETIKYLLKALYISPLFITRKRGVVIVINLLKF